MDASSKKDKVQTCANEKIRYSLTFRRSQRDDIAWNQGRIFKGRSFLALLWLLLQGQLKLLGTLLYSSELSNNSATYMLGWPLP